VYNAIEEMLKAVDVNGFELTVEYDWIGRRTAMHMPLLAAPYNKFPYARGPEGRMQSADMGRKEYFFDPRGNLARENDNVLRGRGAEIKYIYDSLNRLVKIDYPASPDTTYEYGAPNATDG
jgi:YD repeat-containing protein